MLKTAGIAALSVSLALGFSGAAGATPAKDRMSKQHTVTDTGIGRYVLSPGDSKAKIARSYPNIDPNPPSLAQTYNLRGRIMTESRK